MEYFVLFLVGTIAFTISSFTAGGGGLLSIPVLNTIIGIQSTAPVLHIASSIGRPVRLLLFWKYVNWNTTLYYTIPAIIGSYFTAMFFSSVRIEWIQVVLGVFLISTVFQFRFGKSKRSFPVKLWYFIPLGFLLSVLSTFTGGVGPILNPFYLNYGLEKEALIATKTANSFFVGIAQVGSYAYFGMVDQRILFWGISMGMGIALGSFISKRLLPKVTTELFRKLVIYMMVLSGLVMIGKVVISN